MIDPLEINDLCQPPPCGASDIYTDWARFEAAWPVKMCRAADSAFTAYTMGLGTWEEFETARDMADRACRENIPEIKPMRCRANVKGTVPEWYRKRLERAMGPERFNHYRTPPGWRWHWLEFAGTTKAHVPTVISTRTGSEVVYSEQKLFGFDLLRPWVFDREHPVVTTSHAKQLRLVFLHVLERELREPHHFAKHTRCDLFIQRMSHRGWGYIRCFFMPWNFHEPAELTPNTMVLSNCKCITCNRRKARLNGYPRPKNDLAYLDVRGRRIKTYDPQ